MTADVLLVFPHHASFIDQDLDLLRTKFDVDTLEYSHRGDRFALFSKLRRSRVGIAWFVLGYAYAMVRLRPLTSAACILVAGGWDVEAIPALNYGEMLSARRARRTSYALANADRVLAVSSFTLSKVRKWAPRSPVEILYHGLNGDLFVPEDGERRGVLTVARIASATWDVKGLGTFVETAKRFPDIPFTIVGPIHIDINSAQFPANVRTTGFLEFPKLLREYQRSRVYAQLSAVESFGCSLAEAMLCGCMPVVTDRGALPEVVGPAGEIVPYGDVDSTVEAIKRALGSDRSRDVRNRILKEFPIDRRKEGLIGEVERLLGG